MGVQVGIETKVVEWLASMGYPVAGMPRELIHGMLLHEARQWQLSPSDLRSLIDECSNSSSGYAATVSSPSSTSKERTNRGDARPERRASERLVGMSF